MTVQQRVLDSAYLGSSIVGVATPPQLSALYRDLMSPYCPGLSLASCPSPQADSLRNVIAERFGRGETPAEITSALVVDYGAGIRGSPALEGFGAVAFVVPILLLIGGAIFAQRWLRRHTRRAAARQMQEQLASSGSGTQLLTALLFVLPMLGCSSNEQASDTQNVSASVVARDVPWATDAWMRVGDSASTTGAYGTIHNPFGDSLQIVGITSAVADTVEIHETMDHGGMVHMAPQLALTIAPADSVVLAPGGKHFMVKALTRALVVGETVTLRVAFANGTSLDVPCEVLPITGR